MLLSCDGHHEGAAVDASLLARGHTQLIRHHPFGRIAVAVGEHNVRLVRGQVRGACLGFTDEELAGRNGCADFVGEGFNQLLGDLIGSAEIAKDFDIDAHGLR